MGVWVVDGGMLGEAQGYNHWVAELADTWPQAATRINAANTAGNPSELTLRGLGLTRGFMTLLAAGPHPAQSDVRGHRLAKQGEAVVAAVCVCVLSEAADFDL